LERDDATIEIEPTSAVGHKLGNPGTEPVVISVKVKLEVNLKSFNDPEEADISSSRYAVAAT